MKEFQYTIKDPLGVHARPAGKIVAAIKNFDCFVTVWVDGRDYDLKKLLGFIGSDIKCGDVVVVRTEGTDEDAALEAAKKAFEENL